MANEIVKEDAAQSSAFMSLLKRHRMGLGLTQEQMAKRCNVTTGTYSTWETGRSVPTPSRFKKLAQVLNMAPMDLSLILVPVPGKAEAPATSENQPGEAKAAAK